MQIALLSVKRQQLIDTSIQSLFNAGLRFWLFSVFFQAGLTKIQSWQSTLMLFEYEYTVPLLTPQLAAWSGTAVELIFPWLLLLGLFTRSAAAVLFVFNIVAWYAYPDISAAGVKDHIVWGIMLAYLMFYGGEKLALDRLNPITRIVALFKKEQ